MTFTCVIEMTRHMCVCMHVVYVCVYNHKACGMLSYLHTDNIQESHSTFIDVYEKSGMCILARTYTHMHACMNVGMYTHVCMYAYAHMQA
jgi:hypothetical protein